MSAQIAELVSRLMSVSRIEKVISVDDDNSATASPEELLGVLASVDGAVLLEIGKVLGIDSGERDLIRDRVRNDWGALDEAVRDELLARLTPPEEKSPESVKLAADLRVASRLPEIFGEKLESMTLGEWEKRIGEFVNDQMPPTLLLIDLSFTGEQRGKEEGLKIIGNLLKMHPKSKIYCGLLTSLYHLSSVHEDWKAIAAESSLDRERFVLIPKDSLEKDAQPFLALIKLVVMNSPANTLRETLITAFEDCLKETSKSVEKLDVFEFERIVCLTSSIEGVWEPDTLLRIISLFHRKFVRKRLRNDSDVYKCADHLRALSAIPIGEWGGPTEMEVALRQLEWFDQADELNQMHLPIELGDVFEIESRPGKRYVLLAQPCDLMMRQRGERHYTVENALLLEATHAGEKPADSSISSSGEHPRDSSISDSEGQIGNSKISNEDDDAFYFRLEFYESHQDWRVSLRQIHYVNLDVLDLCVFSSRGQAEFSTSDKVPDLLSHAWRARHPRLMKVMSKACKRYVELMKIRGMKADDAAKLVLSASLGNLIKVIVDPKGTTLRFDIKRVGRIKQPRAGALLSSYANSLARDAFEHDLTQRPKYTKQAGSPEPSA